MSDLIDRNSAVEAIEFEKVYMTAYKGSSNGYVSEGNPFKQYNKGLDDAIKAINNLSSVYPKQMKGEWIDAVLYHEPDDFEWEKVKCSSCKIFVTKPFFYYDDKYNFCPNCGAKMSKGE